TLQPTNILRFFGNRRRLRENYSDVWRLLCESFYKLAYSAMALATSSVKRAIVLLIYLDFGFASHRLTTKRSSASKDMKYPIQSAIDDFDSMVRSVAPRVAQKPQYLAVKSGWQDYLMFLEPLVSGRHHFSAEAMDKFWPEVQRTLTSIKDEQVVEK